MNAMRFIFLMILAMVSAVATAQDIIIKKDGQELNVKVERVLENIIVYRPDTNQVAQVMERSEIFMIKYADGSKELMTQEAPKPVEPVIVYEPEEPAIHPDSISYIGRLYYIGGSRASEGRVNKMMINSPDSEVRTYIRKKRELTVISKVMKYSSIPVAVVGTYSAIYFLALSTLSYYGPETTITGIVGAVGITGFVALQIGSAAVERRRLVWFRKAINAHNNKLVYSNN